MATSALMSKPTDNPYLPGRNLAMKKDPKLCQWFALCKNAATQTRPHPILGDVPICDRCAKRVDDDRKRGRA